MRTLTPASCLQIADEFVSDISTVIKVGDTVQVCPILSFAPSLPLAPPPPTEAGLSAPPLPSTPPPPRVGGA